MVYELFDRLHWSTNTSAGGTPVVGFVIYKNGRRIAEVDASEHHYDVHNVRKGARVVYGVASIDANGVQSAITTIIVTGRDDD